MSLGLLPKKDRPIPIDSPVPVSFILEQIVNISQPDFPGRQHQLQRTRRMRGALATLRERIERIETHGALAPNRIALGHREADAALQGGLARGALHEVFTE